MTAIFDPTLTTLKDHIRLALGDRHNLGISGVVALPLLQDEVIDAKLAAFTYQEALAQLSEALVAEYGQKPDEYSESGGIRIKWGERVKAWQKVADNARAGKIVTPGTVQISRPGAAVQELTTQSQTTSTARVDTSIPTVMEGFRSD
jgi:hypothetical protein